MPALSRQQPAALVVPTPVRGFDGPAMKPGVGVFTGAAGLGEAVHWQDWTAVALTGVAILSVPWPGRAPVAEPAVSSTASHPPG